MVANNDIKMKGIDFQEIFSSVVRMNTLLVLFVLATAFDLHLYQIDVKTDFLNG